MPWNDANKDENQEACQPDAQAIRQLRRKVFLHGACFSAFSCVAITSLVVLHFLQIFHTASAARDAAPNAAQFELIDVLADRPDLIAGSVGLAVLGALFAAWGVWVVVRALGKKNRPPRVVLMFSMFVPIAFGLMGTGMIAASGKIGEAVLLSGIAMAMAFQMTPAILTVLAVGSLTLAYRLTRQRQVFVETSELPEKAVAYFNEVEPEILEAGLDPIGDIQYEFSSKNKCRRLWANKDRTFFASAAWFPMGQMTLATVCAYAVTDNGSYLEAANLDSNLFTPPKGHEHLFWNGAGASPTEVLNSFSTMFRKWIEESGSLPMQIADDEHAQLSAYGLAFLHSAQAATTGRSIAAYTWLANPYHGKALPPIPGRAWQPEADGEHATETLVTI